MARVAQQLKTLLFRGLNSAPCPAVLMARTWRRRGALSTSDHAEPGQAGPSVHFHTPMVAHLALLRVA